MVRCCCALLHCSLSLYLRYSHDDSGHSLVSGQRPSFINIRRDFFVGGFCFLAAPSLLAVAAVCRCCCRLSARVCRLSAQKVLPGSHGGKSWHVPRSPRRAHSGRPVDPSTCPTVRGNAPHQPPTTHHQPPTAGLSLPLRLDFIPEQYSRVSLPVFRPFSGAGQLPSSSRTEQSDRSGVAPTHQHNM